MNRHLIIAAALSLGACSSGDAEKPAQTDTPAQAEHVPAAVRLYEAQQGYVFVDRFCDGQTAVYVTSYYYKATAISTVPNAKECGR